MPLSYHRHCLDRSDCSCMHLPNFMRLMESAPVAHDCARVIKRKISCSSVPRVSKSRHCLMTTRIFWRSFDVKVISSSQHLGIENIRWPFPTCVGDDILTGDGCHERTCLQRCAGDVWQKHNIFHHEQLWLDGWFALKDIQ